MQPVFLLGEKKYISFKCKSQLMNAKKFLLPRERLPNAVLSSGDAARFPTRSHNETA